MAMVMDTRALAIATRAMQPFDGGGTVPWATTYRVVHEVAKEVWEFMHAENETLAHELAGVKSANEYMGRLHRTTCDQLDAMTAERDKLAEIERKRWESAAKAFGASAAPPAGRDAGPVRGPAAWTPREGQGR